MPDYPSLPPRPKLRTQPPLSTEGNYGIRGKHRLEDPEGTLTGRYDPDVIEGIVQAAQRHGVDPVTALSVGLQESTLGERNDLNPMSVLRSPYDTDIDVDTVWNTNPAGASKLARDRNIDTGVGMLAGHAKRYASEPESKQLQAYNGLGRPSFSGKRAYGGQKVADLPDNFYGTRIQNIRERMRPSLEGLVKAVQ